MFKIEYKTKQTNLLSYMYTNRVQNKTSKQHNVIYYKQSRKPARRTQRTPRTASGQAAVRVIRPFVHKIEGCFFTLDTAKNYNFCKQYFGWKNQGVPWIVWGKGGPSLRGRGRPKAPWMTWLHWSKIFFMV